MAVTSAEILEAIDAAILAKAENGALLSYTHKGVTVQTESIAELLRARRDLKAEVSTATGGIILGVFPP